MRSATSLIQTSGRAARHEKGRVILYADVMTKSIVQTLEVTSARREKQLAYNLEHDITPVGVTRSIDDSLQTPGKRYDESESQDLLVAESADVDVVHVIAELESEMLEAAQKLEFEKAAILRDQIETLQTGKHGGGASGGAKTKVHKRKKAVYNAKGLPKKRRS